MNLLLANIQSIMITESVFLCWFVSACMRVRIFAHRCRAQSVNQHTRWTTEKNPPRHIKTKLRTWKSVKLPNQDRTLCITTFALVPLFSARFSILCTSVSISFRAWLNSTCTKTDHMYSHTLSFRLRFSGFVLVPCIHSITPPHLVVARMWWLPLFNSSFALTIETFISNAYYWNSLILHRNKYNRHEWRVRARSLACDAIFIKTAGEFGTYFISTGNRRQYHQVNFITAMVPFCRSCSQFLYVRHSHAHKLYHCLINGPK